MGLYPQEAMHSKLMIVKVKAINYVQEREGKIRDSVGGFFKGAIIIW